MSPLEEEEEILKAQPKAAAPKYGGAVNTRYDQSQVRGTQFYDFYRDSGFIFSNGRQK